MFYFYSGDSGSVSESGGSGKSSPGTFNDHPANDLCDDPLTSGTTTSTTVHQTQLNKQMDINGSSGTHLLLDDNFGSTGSLNGIGLSSSSALSQSSLSALTTNNANELMNGHHHHNTMNGGSNPVIDTSGKSERNSERSIRIQTQCLTNLE